MGKKPLSERHGLLLSSKILNKSIQSFHSTYYEEDMDTRSEINERKMETSKGPMLSNIEKSLVEVSETVDHHKIFEGFMIFGVNEEIVKAHSLRSASSTLTYITRICFFRNN